MYQRDCWHGQFWRLAPLLSCGILDTAARTDPTMLLSSSRITESWKAAQKPMITVAMTCTARSVMS